MKRILAVLLLALFLTASAAGCKCAGEKAVVDEFENSHKILTTKLMKYVNADPNITGNAAASEDDKKKARADWQIQVDKDLQNIQRLKKAMGD